MKYDCYDIQKVYKEFLEGQLNQIEILQQMRDAMCSYASLESFKGAVAESAKAYVSDVHISVVDSIESVLMELEVRLLTLKQDFNATVDPEGSAVIEDTVIDGAITELEGYITSASTHEADIRKLVTSVSDIASLKSPDFSGYNTSMTNAKTNAEETLQKMIDFEYRHSSDMDNVNQMLSAIGSAVSYMSSTSNVSGYVPDSASEMDWCQTLYSGQMQAYFYASNADPNFADTIYQDMAIQTGLTMLDALIPANTDPREIMELLKLGKDGIDLEGISDSARELYQSFQLFKQGIRIVPQIDPATGETILKAVSAAGKSISRSKQVQFLRSIGVADDMGRSASRSLAASLFTSGGLKITGKDAFKLKKGMEIGKETIEALTEVAKAGKDSSGFMKNFAQGIKGIGKVGWVLYGVTIVIDAADSCYDERTRKFGELDVAEFAAKATVDTVSFLAPIAAGAAAGAAWGSVVPGIGTLVGAGVGIIMAGCSLIKWGEPPKSVMDHASDWVEGAINDVGNFFAKLFW